MHTIKIHHIHVTIKMYLSIHSLDQLAQSSYFPTNFTASYDYASLSDQLEFSAGQSVGAVACVNVEIIDDNVVEENEESLTLSLTPDDPSFTTITTAHATVIIRENDNDGTKFCYFIL